MNQNDHDRRSYDVEIAELKHEVAELKAIITGLKLDIKGLIEAWNTAKGVTSFVKWLSGMVIAIGVIWSLIIGGRHG